MTTSALLSQADIAAAKAAATTRRSSGATIDWSKAVATSGGGVAATIQAIRKNLGQGKKPPKEQVAIRLDQEVLGAFRAGGPGWQTRMNAALKEWLASRPAKRKPRERGAV